MKVLGLLLLGAALPALAAVHYVTVAGLGGEPDYEQRFDTLAKDVDKILKGSGGDVHVHTLVGDQATKARIFETLAAVAQAAKPEDALVVMLIGHGTFDGVEYKFNVKGPDVTAVELAAQCDRVPAQRQLVVNTTSASGGSIQAIQKANRAVIAATKTGNEKNATVFARYWVEALRDPAADTDKNETVSALEAYRYADRKTVSFYETQKRLATEHAMLEDTGKGGGVRAPSNENGHGLLASRLPLLRLGSVQRAAADPAKQQLLVRKEQIEQKLDQLKYEKAAMAAADYRKQLQGLLLELARIQEALDK